MKKTIVIFSIFIFVVNLISCCSNKEINYMNNKEKLVILKELDDDLVEISGVIKEIYETSMLIINNDGRPYIIQINETLKFNNNVNDCFETGNAVTFGFSGVHMKTYPMLINPVSVIKNEVVFIDNLEKEK